MATKKYMSETSSLIKSNITTFRYPKLVISRFIFKQSIKSAAIWAFIIAAYVASKGIGYGKIYPTPQARAKLASTLGNNVGLSALIGKPHDLVSVGGYTAWNTIGVIEIVLAIWVILLTTRALRGAEDTGRWEILLAGRTTAKKALLNALGGLFLVLTILYLILCGAFAYIGTNKYVNYPPHEAFFFALATIAVAGIFISIAALTSQLMPSRSKAAGLASFIFGIFFILRAAGDITNLHWLLYLTPLGWIENLRPLSNSNPFWLLPIFVSIVLISLISIYLSSHRDLGDSIFKDKPESKPRLRLLNHLIPSGIRFTYLNNIGWLSAISLMALFYGVLTKSAAQALAQSTSSTKAFHNIIHSGPNSVINIFLGVAFLIYIILIMSFSAAHISKLREEEATNLADNFFVRPIKRYTWLNSRCFLIAIGIIIAAILSGLFTYLGVISQNATVDYKDLIIASLNCIIPGLFTLGVGVFALGFLPRLTSIIAYSVIGWSFLIEMLSSGIKLNHWILDTSLLTHISLSPAVSINWRTNFIILGIGTVLFVLGLLRFNNRDLVTE
ncbi:MAG TPA: hypothetical protein VLF63_03190 [Patescibacteria group bacterium]|nr:hypothetical protein [Patescibacteria group bacterium]